MIDLARHEHFQLGDVHTGFIQQHYDSLFPNLKASDSLLTQAAIAVVLNDHNAALINALNSGNTGSLETNFRVNQNFTRNLSLKFDGKLHKIAVQQNEDGFKVRINDGGWKNVKTGVIKHAERFSLRVNIDGNRSSFSAVISPENVAIFNQVSFVGDLC